MGAGDCDYVSSERVKELEKCTERMNRATVAYWKTKETNHEVLSLAEENVVSGEEKGGALEYGD